MNKTAASVVVCLALAYFDLGCGVLESYEFARRPSQDRAEAIVRDFYRPLFDAESLCDEEVPVEWFETLCPYPAADGTYKTAVIWRGKCYAGLSWGHYVQVAWRGRFSNSAYAHELMHVFMEELKGYYDLGHDKYPEFWKRAAEANTVLFAAGL